MEHTKFSVSSFALACGLLWAFTVLILGLSAKWVGYGHDFVRIIGHFYIGYRTTISGIIIGTVWAFIDAFVGGIIFAWLYNFFARKCCKDYSIEQE